MPQAPNTMLWLSNIQYVGEKKQIKLEYSNSEEKLSKRKSFFPKIFLSKKNKELVREILSCYNERKYLLSENRFGLKVAGATFDDLKKIAKLLMQSTQEKFYLLEPERQYMVENNLGYFDSFERKGNEFIKLRENFLPKAKTKHFPVGIYDTIEMMLGEERLYASELTDRIVLANLLAIRPEKVSVQEQSIPEIFLENIFFRNNFPLPEKAAKEKNSFYGFGRRKWGYAEIDFSSIWPFLLSGENYNIGFDSLNCGCCSATLNDLVPHSKVKAIFKKNGLYIYNSCDKEYANEFHNSNELKENRERMKREYFLNSIPIGPFFEGKEYIVPAGDLGFFSEDEFKIIGVKEGSWFCKKNQSFLSKEINSLTSKAGKTIERISGMEKQFMKEFNLLATGKMKGDADYLFLERNNFWLNKLASKTIQRIFSEKSKFHEQKLCSAIKSIQEKAIKEFSESTEKARISGIGRGKVQISKEEAFSAAKAFSRQFNTPIPRISYS